MRRYRTVILVFLFGIVPMVGALVLAVTVVLPSLNQTDAAVDQVEVVEEAPSPEPVMVRVALTATRPLPPGALLTDGDVVLEEVLEADVPLPDERYVYVDDVEDLAEAKPRQRVQALRGYAVRRPVAAGAPIDWAQVVGPDDAQFLATVLEADRVAVSIPVSLATRQAKLVSPGNRVDVLLAVEQEGELVVRTIVEDVRVIAVNSRVITEEDVRTGEQGRPAESGDDASDGVLPGARPEVTTVTLEVQPLQGEHLALGAYEGQLSLAIRPLANAPLRSAEPVQNLRSVLRLPEPDPEPEPSAEPAVPQATPVSVRVVRGISEETVTFVDEGTGPGRDEASAARDGGATPDGVHAAEPTAAAMRSQ